MDSYDESSEDETFGMRNLRISDNGGFGCQNGVSELEHPWKWNYHSTCRPVKPTFNETEDALNKYCIHRADAFREATKGHLLNYSDYPKHVYAFYRVVRQIGSRYLLTPIHREVFGGQRIDLRLVHLTEEAIDRSDEEDGLPSLYIGDVLYVYQLKPTMVNHYARQDRFKYLNKDNDVNIMMKVKHFTPLWHVREYALVPRNIQKEVVVTPYITKKLGKWTMSAYGMERPLRVGRKMFGDIKPKIDDLLEAELFIPVENVDRFVSGIKDKKADFYLHKDASFFMPFDQPTVTVLDISRASIENKNFLMLGTEAFRYYASRVEKALMAVQFSSIWTASQMATIDNSFIDYQIYRVAYEIVRNENYHDAIIKIKLRSQFGPPSIMLWKQGTRVELIIPDGRIRGQVQTSFLNGGHIALTIRLPKAHVRKFRKTLATEKNMKCAVLVQYTIGNDSLLSTLKNFPNFTQMDRSTNGFNILRAMFGGEGISAHIPQQVGSFYAIKQNQKYLLDPYQSRYVHALKSGVPAVVANSPFGCGKTTMMSVAANVLCQQEANICLMISMTNSAVVNLVEACEKNESVEEYNILRIISEGNHQDVEETSQTEYDGPIIMEKTLCQLIKDVDRRLVVTTEISTTLKEQYEIAVFYMLRKDVINDEDMDMINSAYGRHICDKYKKNQIPEKLESKAFDLFLKLYKPRRIACTLSTALRAFTYKWKSLKDNIGTIQVDEASQLPQIALVALLVAFPNARFTLVGDYRQLPPYVPTDATKNAKKFVSAQTLERCHIEQMLPSVSLRHIYRSHPYITNLLSKVFYNGQLLTNIEAKDRKSVTKLSWWKNSGVPLVFINNDSECEMSGTSFFNSGEINCVQDVIGSLLKQINPENIGVASFYKAQVNRLQNVVKDALVGTVDAFQGRERDVMIICTTKTNAPLSDFMLDNQRINVALSRARDMIIIIGNMNILREEQPWKQIIDPCIQNKHTLLYRSSEKKFSWF